MNSGDDKRYCIYCQTEHDSSFRCPEITAAHIRIVSELDEAENPTEECDELDRILRKIDGTDK